MRRDLRMVRGTTKSFSGIARRTNGTPIDLTGATLSWRFGANDKRATSFTLTNSDDITVAAGTGGGWTVTVKPVKTASLSIGLHSHQGEITEADGTISLFTNGNIDLRRDLS